MTTTAITITIDDLERAFTTWYADVDLNPADFYTAEQSADMPADERARLQAKYFFNVLTQNAPSQG